MAGLRLHPLARFARRVARSRSAMAAGLLAVLALLAPLVGCATNPVTGRRELSLVSAGKEESIGREGYGANRERAIGQVRAVDQR